MGWISRADLDRWFDLQKPDAGDGEKLDQLRAHAKTFALSILLNCPNSADQSAAVRLLRQSLQAAIASVVCRKREPAAGPGPNAYLGRRRPRVELNWSGDSYTWKCPACDAVNYGRSIGKQPAEREVTCERCTGCFTGS